MTDLDRIVLARADEQVRAVKGHTDGRERDSWAPANPRPDPAQPPMRSRCLAGDCDRKVHAAGYCKVHWSRLQRNGTVEETFGGWSVVLHLRRVLPKQNFGRHYRRRAA